MTAPEFVMAMTLMSSGIGLVFFFAAPVRKAMLRKIEGSGQLRDPALEGEVEDLRARLGELEERLEFTERLLARQRDAAGLPPGGFQ
jgi:hypothetical protein